MTITSLTLGRSVEYDLLEQRGVCSVGRNPRLAEFKPTKTSLYVKTRRRASCTYQVVFIQVVSRPYLQLKYEERETVSKD